jgi:hypothetical protein
MLEEMLRLIIWSQIDVSEECHTNPARFSPHYLDICSQSSRIDQSWNLTIDARASILVLRFDANDKSRLPTGVTHRRTSVFQQFQQYLLFSWLYEALLLILCQQTNESSGIPN